jgi:hypothetical protein
MNDVPENWRDWFPYGNAFRFVDNIRLLGLPSRIVTETDYLRHSSLIEAHRVAAVAVVPGVLLAEQAAQSAWLLGRCSGWLKAGDGAMLGRLNCTFELPAPASLPVTADVQGMVREGDTAGFRATLLSNGVQIGKVTMAVRRFNG